MKLQMHIHGEAIENGMEVTEWLDEQFRQRRTIGI